jgi:hypothetical protein
MLNKEEQPSELLQTKPQRQTGLRLMPVLILLGGIVILGAVLVAGWRVYTTDSASPGTRSQTQTGGGTGNGSTSSSGAPSDNYPIVYWQTLRAQFAQGLHMTEQQVENNLQASLLARQTAPSNGTVGINAAAASHWLSGPAQARGISQDQLHTIETTAVQRAYAVLIEQHVLTQQQADEAIQGMSQDELNLQIMEAFFMCARGKASC